VPGFGTKDWKEQREIAPEKTPEKLLKITGKIIKILGM